MKIALSALILSVTCLSSAIDLPSGKVLSDLILGEFDSNRDGNIDLGEWQTGLEMSFETMDGNQDAFLTKSDFELLAAPIAEKLGNTAGALASSLISTIVLGFDEDEDGQVDSSEFQESAGDLFSKVDTDSNSDLSEEELRQLPMHVLR